MIIYFIWEQNGWIWKIWDELIAHFLHPWPGRVVVDADYPVAGHKEAGGDGQDPVRENWAGNQAVAGKNVYKTLIPISII